VLSQSEPDLTKNYGHLSVTLIVAGDDAQYRLAPQVLLSWTTIFTALLT
jgi:hypothetical protein